MGGIAPAQVDQTRGARRGHADGVDQRKVLLHQLVADDAVELGAEPRRQRLRRLRQFFRAHIVRRRIDQVARQRGRLRHPRDIGDVDAVGRHQPDIGPVRLAITAEAIAPKGKGQRREPHIMRRIGKAIDARRQQAGQGAGPEQVAGFAALVLEAENDLRDLPVGRGQRQAFAGLGGEVVGRRKLPGLLGKLPGDHGPCGLGSENDRNGSGVGRGLERGLHAGLAEGDGRGGAVGIARPINRPLGLTVYCWRVRVPSSAIPVS